MKFLHKPPPRCARINRALSQRISKECKKEGAKGVKRTLTISVLGVLLLAVCVFAAAPHGFLEKSPSNDAYSDAVNAKDELEELFPRFTPSASARGIKGAPMLELLTPTEGGEVLLRWRDTELSVASDAVETHLPPERHLREVSDAEIARAAASLAPSVETPYLIWTDLYRLTTYVLKGADGEWTVLRRLPCSAGDEAHPSPEGLFYLGVHREGFGRKGHYSAAWALQIIGNYLYHSVLLTPSGDAILDGRLGERISHGCIRHSLEDSLWLYDTVPDGTAILIR